MYLHEAAAQAAAEGKAIARTGGGWNRISIVPTNTIDCCLLTIHPIALAKANHIGIGRRWNPSLDDLVADDWRVTDYRENNDFPELVI